MVYLEFHVPGRFAIADVGHKCPTYGPAPTDLRWEWEQSDTLVLAFALPDGSYATMVVREVADTEEKPALGDGDQGVRAFGLAGRSNT